MAPPRRGSPARELIHQLNQRYYEQWRRAEQLAVEWGVPVVRTPNGPAKPIDAK